MWKSNWDFYNLQFQTPLILHLLFQSSEHKHTAIFTNDDSHTNYQLVADGQVAACDMPSRDPQKEVADKHKAADEVAEVAPEYGEAVVVAANIGPEAAVDPNLVVDV